MPKVLVLEEIMRRAKIARESSTITDKNRMLDVLMSKLETEHKRVDAENSLWTSDPYGRRHESDDKARVYHKWDNINGIITNDKHRWIRTGLTREQFEYLAKLILEYIIKSGKEELWNLDYDLSSDPGNRCLLSPKQALFLLLTMLKTSITQAHMETEFGIDQTSISRYIRRIIRMLEGMLPTGKRMMKLLDNMTDTSQITELIPEFDNTILVDGTQVRIQRPEDADARKAAYSGKKKTTTFNTAVYTTTNGVILGISDTEPGTAHDFTMFKESLPDMGIIGKSMLDADTPPEERLNLKGDSGYQGAATHCPGANVSIPFKKPRGGSLTDAQKEYNKKLSSKRVTVEHVMGDIKEYNIMSNVFVGDAQKFNRIFNIITGLVNLKKMWPNIPPSLDPNVG